MEDWRSGNFVTPGQKNPPIKIENRDKPGKTPKSEVSLEGNHDPIWDKFGFSENFRPILLHLQRFIPNRTFHEILDRGGGAILPPMGNRGKPEPIGNRVKPYAIR